MEETPQPETPPSWASLAFPANAIVGSVGELARAHARGTEVPEEFYFAAGLTVVGSASATKLTLNTGNEVEPRLYTVLLGESSETKKSTAMRRMIGFFGNLGSANGAPQVAWGVGSAEGLARELASKPSLILAYDELSSFLDKTRVQSSVLLPMVTSFFEGHDWDNSTKKTSGSISIHDAHLSMIGCCTNDTYARMWTREPISIGFPNRLWVVGADRKCKVAWPESPEPAELKTIGDRINQQMKKLPLRLDISSEANTLWTEWYERLPGSEHTRRLDTIGFRLLALIALTTDKDHVDLETVRTVVSMLDYELELRRLTDPIDADNTIAMLEEKIQRYLARGPLSNRELQRRVHAERCGLWAYHAALGNLKVDRRVTEAGGFYRLV